MSQVEQLTSALADRYAIERELGAGGMATVYLAHDVKHDRKVAIKVLRPELAAVIGAERFLREIKTIATLQHPHILGLIDSGELHGTAYYVMPFVEGESLRDRLHREKQLPVTDAVRIATEVAGALDYAHRHGVIHRDIKPENIMLHDGSALVADFGIALAVSSAGGGARMTETGMSLGTPHYMSPEQAMGEREITARSDVYALGAMTYEMLIGDPPFTGSTAQAIIAKVMTSEPADLTEQRRSVPPAVDDAVLTALQKLPADRFATAAEFAAALGGSGASRVRARRPEWLADPRSRAALIVIVMSVAAVALLLVRNRNTSSGLADISFAQNSFRSEAIFNARWAPDEKTIVYSASARGPTPRMYVIRPDYPEPAPLGPDSTHLLAVSRNGELALLTHATHLHHRLFVGTLARMPLGGGSPREVLANVQEADWTPDGTELAITRTVGDHVQLEFPVGTVVYQSVPGGYLSDPTVSPDGDRVAVVEHTFVGDDRGWITVVTRARNAKRVSAEFSGVEGLGWTHDGRGLLFSASENGLAMQVRRADLHGGTQLVLPDAGDLVLQDVGPDGRVLVTSDDLSHGLVARAPGQATDRDISWLDGSLMPFVSADGNWVAFTDVSQSGGINYAAMLRKSDGSPAVRLGEGGVLAIAPDGKSVLGLVSTPPQVWLYPTGAGTPRQLTWTGLKTIASVVFNPDGKSLFVCGSANGNTSRCYRSPLDASSLEPMTPEGIGAGMPRPDGSGVLVQQGDDYAIYPTAGGHPTPVRGIGTDTVLRWSPDGAALWAEAQTPSGLRIDRVDVATGKRSVLLTIDAPPSVFTFARMALADDPRSYVYETRRWLSLLFTVSGVQ